MTRSSGNAASVVFPSPLFCCRSAETVAIVNGRVFPISSPPIEKATVVITDGKITAVGSSVSVPKGARRIDASGLSVYPGWIDGWTRVGLSEISSVSGSVDVAEIGSFNPGAQAWIAVNPHSEMIKTARVNGITTALVAPAGGRVSGVASAMDLFGMYPDQMAVLKNAGVVVNLPAAASARGTFSTLGPTPNPEQRRAEEVEKLKQFLREAKRYSDMRARSAETPGSAIDTGLESMLPIIRRQRPMIVPADSYRDIRAAIDLANDFGLKLVIAGGADAWKLTDLLAKNRVAVLYSAGSGTAAFRRGSVRCSFLDSRSPPTCGCAIRDRQRRNIGRPQPAVSRRDGRGLRARTRRCAEVDHSVARGNPRDRGQGWLDRNR